MQKEKEKLFKKPYHVVYKKELAEKRRIKNGVKSKEEKKNIALSSISKICSWCKEDKKKNEFGISSRNLDGLCYRCKVCDRIKRGTEKVKEYNKTYNRINIARLRNEIIDKFGAKCKNCGFADRRALQIDHVRGGGSKELKKNNGSKYLKNVLASFSQEENPYQLLCANCNWIKRYTHNEK